MTNKQIAAWVTASMLAPDHPRVKTVIHAIQILHPEKLDACIQLLENFELRAYQLVPILEELS